MRPRREDRRPRPRQRPDRELDFRAAVEAALLATDIEETRTVTCQSCGAEVEFDPDTHASECPFCATPVVTDTGVNRHIKPGGLLPFALDEDAARAGMRDWLGQLWFAPERPASATPARAARCRASTSPTGPSTPTPGSSIRGERGTVYTEMRTVVRNGKRQHRAP